MLSTTCPTTSSPSIATSSLNKRPFGWFKITHVLLFVAIVLLSSCRGDDAESVPHQITVVERVRTDWEHEKQRLQTMRDSLEAKVAVNIEIGMTSDRARALENALIQSQEALVKASKLHYEAQSEVLKQMQGL